MKTYIKDLELKKFNKHLLPRNVESIRVDIVEIGGDSSYLGYSPIALKFSDAEGNLITSLLVTGGEYFLLKRLLETPVLASESEECFHFLDFYLSRKIEEYTCKTKTSLYGW